MAETTTPTANRKDEIYLAMERLLRDAQRVRSAHFIAAQRKSKKSKIIGVSVIVLNLLITSGLIEVTIPNQTKLTIAIKLVSFLAAALAGIQTIFNFQKEIECHTNNGDVYGTIYRRMGLVMAEYQEKPANHDALIIQFKTLNDEYLKANDASKVCVPTEGDFKNAASSIEKRRKDKKL